MRTLHLPADTTSKRAKTDLLKQFWAHVTVAALLFLSVFYVDQSLPSELTAWSRILGILWCVIVALALSHIVHEWFHFLGALVGRASVTIKPRVHPLFFDFDFPSNDHSQFLWLSFGGLLGNILLIAYFAMTHFQNDMVANSLLAAALGQFVFVLILELPVSLRVIAGQAPLTALTEHFSQGASLFLRALLFGVITASIVAVTRSLFT